MFHNLTRPSENLLSSLPPFATNFAAQWQQACDTFEDMLFTNAEASEEWEGAALSDMIEKRRRKGQHTTFALRPSSSSTAHGAPKRESRQEELDRLARQRVRMDALHAELEEWAAEEATAAKGERRESNGPTTRPRQSSADNNGPPTAPHSPLTSSASLPLAKELQPPTPPHVALPLPSSSIERRGSSEATDTAIPATLVVNIDSLDASLRLALPRHLVVHYDQAEERYGKGDYSGALVLLEGLERRLALSDASVEGETVTSEGTSSKASTHTSQRGVASKLGMLGLAARYVGRPSDSNPPLPTSLLTNKALCLYKSRDFRGCLRYMQPMIGTPGTGNTWLSTLDPARVTATGLTLAVRSAILLVDVRSAKGAVSALRKLVASAPSGATANSPALSALSGSINQYGLVIRDLEQYRECLNQKLYGSAMDHITAACGNCFHDIALELIRVECLVHVRAKEADEDIRALLEVFPSEPQLWVWRAILQITEQEPIESLTIASQYLLRALSVDTENKKGRALLKAIRMLNGRLHTADQHQRDKRWQEALGDYQSVIDGSLLRHPIGDEKEAPTKKAMPPQGTKRPSTASTSNDSDLTSPKLPSEDLQIWNEVRDLFAHAAVMSSVRVEALCCLLKGGDAKAVVQECSTILGFIQYTQNGSKSSATQVSPLYVYRVQLASPKTFRIRPAILKSFRAQAYVALGDYTKALLDAKEVYAEAPSTGSKEFIEYIEGHVSGAQNTSKAAGSGGNKRSSSAAAHVSIDTQRKAHFALLGIEVTASAAEVTKAYKTAALKWHPDKWVSASGEERSAAEEHFKKLNQAYSSLQQT